MAKKYQTLSIEEFAGLDFSKYTLVDLREPDELIVSRIEGAINIPFSQPSKKISTIPSDKKVIVYCHSGDYSEEVADILADRDYDVAHVAGGYTAYRKLLKEIAFLDAKGLKCPGPIVKVADYLREKPDGTKIRVEATEDAFFSDIRIWCERTGNRLDDISFTDGIIRADITKQTAGTEL